MAETRTILWVDDEIDMLKPHLLFLQEKGYAVTPVANGDDAVSLVRSLNFDLVLLDENMPGKDGLQTLQEIRQIRPNLPIVMVTRNEAEEIVDQAIGRRADDYLLKPVHPQQILLVIRRLLDRERITATQVAKDYVQQYAELDPSTFASLDHASWIDTYQRLIAWDMRLDEHRNTGLNQTHEDQMRAANYEFCRYVVLLEPYFRLERRHYYGILPTATPYARNALFAGLFPLEIYRRHPQYWDIHDDGERSLNRFERELLELQLQRLGANPALKVRYAKIVNPDDAAELHRLVDRHTDIGVLGLVFNFIDMLAHGRSQSPILQEMAPDEAAFRTVARSWLAHSSLLDILVKLASQGVEVFVTTDHGAVLGRRPTVATGNRDTSTNVRYKYGENLGYEEKGAFKMAEPEAYMLPKMRSTMNYIVAKENFYFVYPTNFRQYERQFFGSFQHGGVSLEEMILPIVHLVPRR